MPPRCWRVVASLACVLLCSCSISRVLAMQAPLRERPALDTHKSILGIHEPHVNISVSARDEQGSSASKSHASSAVDKQASSTVDTPAPAHEAQPHVKPCWVFTHMQKAGGSTVKTIIRHRWGAGQHDLFNTEDWKQGGSRTDQYVEAFFNGRSLDIVYGATTEGMRISPEFRETCKWFTVFRHPIDRLVSAYFYCKIFSTDNLCAREVWKGKDVGLLSFAKHWGNYGLRQFAFGQIPADLVLELFANGTLSVPGGVPWQKTHDWYLLKLYLAHAAAGSDEKSNHDGGMEHLLRPVQEVIRRDYAAVGLLEDFNTTIDLFDAALQVPALDWRSQFERLGVKNHNVKFETEAEDALRLAWNSSEVQSYIRLDMLLYETAVEVFRRQARSYGLEVSGS